MDILCHVIRGSASGLSNALVNNVFPVLVSFILRSDDNAILQVCWNVYIFKARCFLHLALMEPFRFFKMEMMMRDSLLRVASNSRNFYCHYFMLHFIKFLILFSQLPTNFIVIRLVWFICLFRVAVNAFAPLFQKVPNNS